MQTITIEIYVEDDQADAVLRRVEEMMATLPDVAEGIIDIDSYCDATDSQLASEIRAMVAEHDD